MKSLVVFYSLEGHTKLVAKMIADEMGAELLQLRPEKDIPKGKIKKYIWGGASVVFKKKPALKTKMPNLKKYDTIVIGTPVWAGTYTPALNSFLSNHEVKNKKVAFFACHAGGGAKKCFNRFEKELASNNKVLGSIEFTNPAQANRIELKANIKQWIADTQRRS